MILGFTFFLLLVFPQHFPEYLQQARCSITLFPPTPLRLQGGRNSLSVCGLPCCSTSLSRRTTWRRTTLIRRRVAPSAVSPSTAAKRSRSRVLPPTCARVWHAFYLHKSKNVSLTLEFENFWGWGGRGTEGGGYVLTVILTVYRTYTAWLT